MTADFTRAGQQRPHKGRAAKKPVGQEQAVGRKPVNERHGQRPFRFMLVAHSGGHGIVQTQFQQDDRTELHKGRQAAARPGLGRMRVVLWGVGQTE